MRAGSPSNSRRSLKESLGFFGFGGFFWFDGFFGFALCDGFEVWDCVGWAGGFRAGGATAADACAAF
jgi:hypothetical protein